MTIVHLDCGLFEIGKEFLRSVYRDPTVCNYLSHRAIKSDFKLGIDELVDTVLLRHDWLAMIGEDTCIYQNQEDPHKCRVNPIEW